MIKIPADKTTSQYNAGTKITANKSNMMVFLLPWILFWTVTSFKAEQGAMLSIAASTSRPLLWLNFRSTIYECLTNVCVISLSPGILLGGDAIVILIASYYLFGLKWFVSGLLIIPLNPHYSMNQNNDDKALQNPLLVKTNRNLSRYWSVLYPIMPVRTF